MEPSRRKILQGLAGAAACAVAAPGQARVPVMRYAEPPWSGRGSAAERLAETRRRLGAFLQSSPTLPHDWRENADLSHLAAHDQAASLLDSDENATSQEFLLTPQGLQALLDAGELEAAVHPVSADPDLCLFALRGCVAVSSDDVAQPRTEVRLRVARIDHLRPRCVIGLWRKGLGQITVFSASTVANRQAMGFQAAAFGRARAHQAPAWRVANTLAAGAHLFVQGRHGGWHPAALRAAALNGQAHRQPALRSLSGALRRDDLVLDMAVVMDNVHPGSTPSSTGGAEFSSEGCLTVCERRPVQGWSVNPPDWTAFSRLLGLDPRRRPQRQFPLMLLTGAEAWLAANGAAAPALRYGAEGPRTRELRASLGLAPEGRFDAAVLERVLAAHGAPAFLAPPGPAPFQDLGEPIKPDVFPTPKPKV